MANNRLFIFPKQSCIINVYGAGIPEKMRQVSLGCVLVKDSRKAQNISLDALGTNLPYALNPHM